MKNEAYDKVISLVEDKLKQIDPADGFFTKPTILNGYLILYAEDLVRNNKLPAVSFHYDEDSNGQQGGSVDNKLSRTMQVVGAVSTDDPTKVNEQIDQLLKDVKVALCSERYLTIPKVNFMLPENNSAYAMFVAQVVVTINEKWSL